MKSLSAAQRRYDNATPDDPPDPRTTPCDACSGKGRVFFAYSDAEGGEWEDCEECDGTGKIEEESECDGCTCRSPLRCARCGEVT